MLASIMLGTLIEVTIVVIVFTCGLLYLADCSVKPEHKSLPSDWKSEFNESKLNREV